MPVYRSHCSRLHYAFIRHNTHVIVRSVANAIQNPANALARIVARSPYRAPNLYYEITRRGKSVRKYLRYRVRRNVNRANRLKVTYVDAPIFLSVCGCSFVCFM